MLLKNDEGLLPLPPRGRVAVIGGFAKELRTQGAGSSKVCPSAECLCPLDAIGAAVRSRYTARSRVTATQMCLHT